MGQYANCISIKDEEVMERKPWNTIYLSLYSFPHLWEQQPDNSCHKMKSPVLGVGYIQLSYWPKVFHGGTQKAGTVAKTIIGYSPQIEGQILLLKTTPM